VGKAALLLSLLSREDAGSAAPARQQRLLAEPTPLLELAAAAVTGEPLCSCSCFVVPCCHSCQRAATGCNQPDRLHAKLAEVLL